MLSSHVLSLTDSVANFKYPITLSRIHCQFGDMKSVKKNTSRRRTASLFCLPATLRGPFKERPVRSSWAAPFFPTSAGRQADREERSPSKARHSPTLMMVDDWSVVQILDRIANGETDKSHSRGGGSKKLQLSTNFTSHS